MTKEEILAMKAGRELDALIDKEIFGGDGCVHDLYWVDPEEYACSKCHKQFISPEPYSYSSDISAAWQVVEKITLPLIFTLQIGGYPKSWAIAHFGKYGIGGDNAPEAICKAALLAKLEVGNES